MGSKIKTVTSGGGTATPVANDFNSFLRQGLNNGQFGAMGQTTGIGATINSLLQGSGGVVPGQENMNDVMSRYSSSPSYQAPQIGNVLSGVNPIGGAGNFDFTQGIGSRINMPGISGFQLPGQVGGLNYSLGGGGIDLGGILSQVGQRALLGGAGTDQANAVAGGLANRQVDTSGAGNTAEFQNIQNILGQQFNRDIADIRERYGVSSSGLHNENLYRSQALPQMAQALAESARSQRLLGQGDVGLGLQANQTGLQGLLSGAGLGLEARGQDLQNFLGGRQADISTLGLASQQSLEGIRNLLAQRGQDLQGLGLGVEQRGQDLNAILAGRGQELQQRDQDINALLAGRGMDLNQMGLISQNLLGNRGMDIESILGQAGLGLQTGIANQNAGLQGQQLNQSMLNNYGQFALGNAGMGQNQQQLDLQSQIAALGPIFQALMQAQQIGTPQAQTQTFQQPSGFSQVMGGLTGLLGAGASLAGAGGLGGILGGLGGLFGGRSGGGNFQIPNLGSLPGVSMIPGIVPTGPMSPVSYANIPQVYARRQ